MSSKSDTEKKNLSVTKLTINFLKSNRCFSRNPKDILDN